MIDPLDDPLADPGTRERAAKLLRLLASDTVGEAEAARAALLRLLARHGATFGDLARRLLDSNAAASPGAGSPGEVAALRVVLAAAERRAELAEAAARRSRVLGIAGASAGAVLAATAAMMLVVFASLPGLIRQTPPSAVTPVLTPVPATPTVAPEIPGPRPATDPMPAPPPPPALARDRVRLLGPMPQPVPPAADASPIAAPAGPGEPVREAAQPPAAAPAETAPAALPQPEPQPVAATPPVSPEIMARLLRHGDERLALGDLSAARLLYERAAASGSARGARLAARTYDRAYLNPTTADLAADRETALTWYRRAVALGDTEAAERLRQLEAER